GVWVGSFRKPLSASRRAWHSSAAAFRILDPHLAWSFDPRSRPALTVLATLVNAPVADDTNDAEQSTPSCLAFASIFAKAAVSFALPLVSAASRLDASPFRSKLDHALTAAGQNLAACFSLAARQSDVGSPLLFLASAGTAEHTNPAASASVTDARTTERATIIGPPFPRGPT